MKVLAFFGSDLDPVTGPEFLLKSTREGYALLALDSGAMAAATAVGLDYTLMEDWLTPETILRAIEDAALCETGWYQPARDEFTVEGICWPELDLLAMHWFWRTAMIAQAASREFRRRRIDQLRFFGPRFARPAALTERSEVWNALWKEELRERAVELTSRERRETPLRKELLSRAATRLRSLVGNTAGHPSGAEQVVREGSIILMLAQLDTHRTLPLVEDLSRHFPGRVAGVAGGPYRTVAQDMSRQLNIPVAPGAPTPLSPQVPLAPFVDEEDNRFRSTSQIPGWLQIGSREVRRTSLGENSQGGPISFQLLLQTSLAVPAQNDFSFLVAALGGCQACIDSCEQHQRLLSVSVCGRPTTRDSNGLDSTWRGPGIPSQFDQAPPNGLRAL